MRERRYKHHLVTLEVGVSCKILVVLGVSNSTVGLQVKDKDLDKVASLLELFKHLSDSWVFLNWARRDLTSNWLFVVFIVIFSILSWLLLELWVEETDKGNCCFTIGRRHFFDKEIPSW